MFTFLCNKSGCSRGKRVGNMATNLREHRHTAPKLCVSLFVFLLFVVVPITALSVGEARLVRSNTAAKEVEDYTKYYNYVQMTRLLKFMALKYPHIANLSSIGQSVQGRELWVMRITKDPNADVPGKPKCKYVGNMHGDETISRQVLVYLVEYLLTRYGEDPRITELVTRTDIYIMPSMNPDGFEMSREGDCSGGAVGRSNARNMDLNRSFPDQFDKINIQQEDIPEVTAVIKWILEKKFVLSGNLHGGTVVASYPFDDSASHIMQGHYSRSVDDNLFKHLALTYAKNHPVMRTGEPKCPDTPDETFEDGIVNGAKWYDVPERRKTRE